MSAKKFRYIKIKDEQEKKPVSKKKNKKNERVLKNIGHALTVVGTTVSSMMLILVIMLCIVVTVVTVYILDFADNGFDADLREAEMKYTTMVYAYDEEGREVELTRLVAEENRIWVDYEQISPNLINAVVATEDKRFWDHKGVDWRRTVFALGADLFHLSREGQGGSTITQQLIKNITLDDEKTWERKLREIFRALSLEEKYTKFDILESYLNRIGLGGRVYGVGAAAQYYFGKDAKDLDIAESAILAGMIRNPSVRSPYINLENCKNSQLYALENMYEQGMISLREYENAKTEKVKFVRTVYGDYFGYTDPRSIEDETTNDNDENVLDPEDENYDPDAEDNEDNDDDEYTYEAYRWNDYEISQNWYTDAAIDQVINDYADLKGITYTSARNDIYNGGYKIYLNMNMKLQNTLEELYRDPYVAVEYYEPTAKSDELLQSAFVLMDYEGTVLAVAGGLGDKPGDNCFNRATMALRAPGSTMKPISVYATAVQNNLIYYSMMMPDKGITIPSGYGGTEIWPKNYGNITGDGTLMPVWEAVRYSRNTIAVRTAQMLTPQVCYNQLTQNLGITTLVDLDIQYSPITLGALTEGAKLVEMAAAYQIFGNGGIYYKPMLYSRVLDSKDNVILRQDYYGNQAIDGDTAWITNRMLRTVVNAPSGTGTYANFTNIEVVGKTGTSNSGKDLLFIGLTPQYVGAVWEGYDDGRVIPSYGDGHYAAAQIWRSVMSEILDFDNISKFSPDSSVVERRYCMETGLQASATCTKTATGYYRRSYLPGYCTGDHEKQLEDMKKYWEDYDEEKAEAVRQSLRE